MPYLYIYAASDFVTTPPAESGATAAGSAPFTLTLKAGATPTIVEVDDTDGNLDEVNSTGSQTLTHDTTIGGVTYAAGTTYNSAYDLINSTTGHMVTSLHFGGDGYQQGAVDGIVSTTPLEPGVTYTFDSARTSNLQNNIYTGYEDVPCFTPDCLIETERGQVAADQLRRGDRVITEDHGARPILWIGQRDLSARELSQAPHLRPIRIRAGALGDGLPRRDMTVSPQHRLLMRSPITQRMFGAPEVLVAAKALLDLPGISRVTTDAPVRYIHFLLDQHHLVRANGALTESLYTGRQALKSVGSAARAEIFALFPELRLTDTPPPVRPLVPGRKARQLAARHQRNDHHPLCVAQ